MDTTCVTEAMLLRLGVPQSRLRSCCLSKDEGSPAVRQLGACGNSTTACRLQPGLTGYSIK